MEIVKNYQKKRLQINPTKNWTVIRLILLWICLPYKLFTNGFATWKATKNIKLDVQNIITDDNNSITPVSYRNILNSMPVWKTPSFLTYVPTFNVNEVDGKNHLTNIHTGLNSLYLFICNQTPEGKAISNTEPAGKGFMLAMHTTGHLANGFKYDINGHFINDVKSSSAWNLSSANLVAQTTSSESILDKFDTMIQSVVNNDLGLLEFETPDDEIAKEAWLEKPLGKRKLKSVAGMFQPDPSLNGEHALTILAALKLSGIKRGNIDSQLLYQDLLWKNGYALLSLFPTKGVVSPTAMYSLYVLAKNSVGKPELKIWKMAAEAQQKLAYNTDREMLFSGLLYDAFPELLKESIHKNYIMDLNTKLKYVQNKYSLGYLANYTMVKRSINLMLEQNPKVPTV